jgi:hypothetical protein
MQHPYTTGVVFALASGVCQNVGMLLQKRAVDRLAAAERESRFFSRLLRQPLWITGLALSFGVGTVFFLLAQVEIGPALIPGLMAFGLVVLILGSLPITGDRLTGGEIAGVALMAGGTALLGFSRLAIDLREYDVLSPRFLLRAGVFTLVATALMLAAQVVQRRGGRRRGIALAVLSGLLYVLSNFWVGPFVGVTLKILGGAGRLPHVAMFVFTSAVLVLTNLFAIGTLQSSFRYCKAAQAVPIQNVPVQLAPALVYLVVFRLVPPAPHSVNLMAGGVCLILVSSFLLARRQARVESRPATQ